MIALLRARASVLLMALVLGVAGCSDDATSGDGGVTQEGGGLCSPASCQGCCLGNLCQKGDEAAACGSAGLACVSCPDGEACVAGQCIVATGKCNVTNCPDGCCDGEQCVPGGADDACGQGGRLCQNCGSSSKCIANRCDCDAASCPGCCEAGTCKSGTDRESCGKSGISCVKCGINQLCSSSGVCTDTTGCSASNCAGCCDGPECKGGNSDQLCGKGGIACNVCKSGETCQAGICNNPATCGPGSCNGCCSASVCLMGRSKANCGTNGGLCETCKSYELCSATKGCELNNDALWGITVVSATIDPSKGWDTWPANSAPDVYMELTVGTLTFSTSQKDNDYDPVWNEYLGAVKTGVILNVPMQIKILDNDSPFGPETVGACSATVALSVLTSSSQTVVNSCGQYVSKIYFKFTPQ